MRFMKQAHVAQEGSKHTRSSWLCIVAAYLPFTIYHFQAFSLPANVLNRFLAKDLCHILRT